MAYCGPGDRLIDPPEDFQGGSSPTRHRHWSVINELLCYSTKTITRVG